MCFFPDKTDIRSSRANFLPVYHTIKRAPWHGFDKNNRKMTEKQKIRKTFAFDGKRRGVSAKAEIDLAGRFYGFLKKRL
jgi:hypothetical protein